MAKRSRRSRPAKPKRRAARRRPQRRQEEPDLVDRIADALDDDDPLALLVLASSLLEVADPRARHPLRPDPDAPTRDELVESLLAVPLPETSAALAALAALSGDEVLRRRVGREVADRADPLPEWLADLSRTTALPDAVEVTHALGDGDDIVVGVSLPGGHALTAVVLVEHNLGSIVKDAFVVSDPLDEVLAVLGQALGAEPDLTARPLRPADAKVRITDAVEHSARTFPPYETETWPACRALVEWMIAPLPEGGTGHERPEWDDDATAELARRFRASPYAVDLDDPGDMLSSLLWFGTGYGPGDPLRWSPVAVEILLLDWIPRKIVADVPMLTPAPDVLRAFVRFCHAERGIRPGLTDETLAAIDEFEPEYQRLIRSDRKQGPAALIEAAMGVFDDDLDDDLDLDLDLDDVDPGAVVGEIMLDGLRRTVGGGAALDALDAEPLPDEPFDRDAVPADVRERVGEVLALVERCCAELLDEEYRTACRRLLADVAAADPGTVRRGRPETVAAAVCWIAGRANSLFDDEPVTPKMQVKQLTAYFGLGGNGVSQRGTAFLRAIGVDPRQPYSTMDMGTTRYLTGRRRARILDHRDRYRAMAG